MPGWNWVERGGGEGDGDGCLGGESVAMGAPQWKAIQGAASPAVVVEPEGGVGVGEGEEGGGGGRGGAGRVGSVRGSRRSGWSRGGPWRPARPRKQAWLSRTGLAKAADRVRGHDRMVAMVKNWTWVAAARRAVSDAGWRAGRRRRGCDDGAACRVVVVRAGCCRAASSAAASSAWWRSRPRQ